MKIDKIKKGIGEFLLSETMPATAAKIILASAAIGGIVIVGAAAPGIFKAVSCYERSRKFKAKQFENAFHNLRKRKLIEVIKEKDGSSVVRLTSNGQERVMEFSIETVKIKPQGKWDQKWRVLIFDIPAGNVFNQARAALREKIKELGFAQIQKSVWAFPFPCEDELLFIADHYNVRKYVELLVVDRMLHEDILLSRFKLRKHHPR